MITVMIQYSEHGHTIARIIVSLTIQLVFSENTIHP